ncbi:hypothetical protein CRENBAI_026618 [Crenichthys baileyi]|uniref:Transmembrane protein n=1 Tax=Crenichthys baileyi TaxID=28760 RepID=A0AAV9RC10_9TELE
MKDSPSPSHRSMTSLCVSRPSNQHPVRLIHHPITFRRLVFKGLSAVFLLACQLSSSAVIMSDYESDHFSGVSVWPPARFLLPLLRSFKRPASAPVSDLDATQLAQLAELLPRPRLPFPSPPTLTVSPFFKKACEKVRSSSSQKRRRGRFKPPCHFLLPPGVPPSPVSDPFPTSFTPQAASYSFSQVIPPAFFASINALPGVNLLAHSTSPKLLLPPARQRCLPPLVFPGTHAFLSPPLQSTLWLKPGPALSRESYVS